VLQAEIISTVVQAARNRKNWRGIDVEGRLQLGRSLPVGDESAPENSGNTDFLKLLIPGSCRGMQLKYIINVRKRPGRPLTGCCWQGARAIQTGLCSLTVCR